MTPAKFALAVHGGAGNIRREHLTPTAQAASRAALEAALQTGHAILKANGSSLNAVEAAVRVLEDSPLFNAGHGASLNHDGHAELDASIMDGHTLQAGAVAGVTTIRNPISAARSVMERSPYVLLIGKGAEAFAHENGLESVENSYFHTPHQIEKLQTLRQNNAQTPSKNEKYGTVGAVALDQRGNLAAATSTGGMMGKCYSRVGDSPIIGAGTYANNATCAVSTTGHGEHFLCNVVAYDISAQIEYKGLTIQAATEEVVLKKLVARNGEGGVIAIDTHGNIALTFNTPGMYRGHITTTGKTKVAIFQT